MFLNKGCHMGIPISQRIIVANVSETLSDYDIDHMSHSLLRVNRMTWQELANIFDHCSSEMHTVHRCHLPKTEYARQEWYSGSSLKTCLLTFKKGVKNVHRRWPCMEQYALDFR